MMRMHGMTHAVNPQSPGQEAFRAIQEIIGTLEADANTD
jgi:hypothetical protein